MKFVNEIFIWINKRIHSQSVDTQLFQIRACIGVRRGLVQADEALPHPDHGGGSQLRPGPLLQVGTLHAVWRIRDVYPGSDFFPSRIRTVSIPFLSSKPYDPGCSFMLTFSDPGSRGEKGAQSRILDPDQQHWPHVSTSSKTIPSAEI